MKGIDYYDIKTWKADSRGFADYLINRKEHPIFIGKNVRFSTNNLTSVTPLDIYALLRVVKRLRPNGPLMMFIRGYPLNNPTWWDFVLSSDIGYINITRTSTYLTVNVFTTIDFNGEKFLKENVEKYRQLVDDQISLFEQHDLYINHYDSYQQIVRYLDEEICKIDLTKPVPPDYIVGTSEANDSFIESLKKYTQNCTAFHALGKSLLLDSVFMAEALINLIVRLRPAGEAARGNAALKRFLHKKFEDKLATLNMNCGLLINDIDLTEDRVIAMLALVTMRNKYVHADVTAKQNHVGTVYFDGLYPLRPVATSSYIAEGIDQAFGHPTEDEVKSAKQTADNFIKYILSLIDPREKEFIDNVTQQNPLGRNTHTKRYSLVSPKEMVMAIMQGK